MTSSVERLPASFEGVILTTWIEAIQFASSAEGLVGIEVSFE
jgi:hypothetical protein